MVGPLFAVPPFEGQRVLTLPTATANGDGGCRGARAAGAGGRRARRGLHAADVRAQQEAALARPRPPAPGQGNH